MKVLELTLSMAEETTQRTSCQDLVVVCCHATYTGSSSDDIKDEANWILQPFQRRDAEARKPSEVNTFVKHILVGASLGRELSALLVFSGGRTAIDDQSEAQGYFQVYQSLIQSGQLREVAHPCSLDDYATDSYQNLLFSILRYRQHMGRYPEYVTVVTHAFKERRFLELHAKAIKWPSSRIRVQGFNPPFTLQELEQTQQLEHERAHELFVNDPYGSRPPLSEKRRARKWNFAVIDKLTADASVKRLLAWEGGKSGHEVFPGRLPWEEI
ncbi:hypothetical protein LTR22_022215 [Elasticomyces elasticus]|nr:hypothetical protein LTR22_022215 [Elasticomyces elasticus]KAK4909225.1 hypothetical protein LTR49_021977 [Elasticomyces elasticus]KAK5743895.1 hypothetical protein LTS12_023697 [Elasticomyces elasticus]